MLRFTMLIFTGLLVLAACNAEDSRPTGLVGAVGNEPWLHGDHENPCGISVEPTDSDTKYDYGYARCSEGGVHRELRLQRRRTGQRVEHDPCPRLWR